MSEPQAVPARLFTAPDPVPALAVDAAVPITLLPLRIETRFVRVVKDAVIHTLEEAQTELDQGDLTVAAPDLVPRVINRIRRLGMLAAEHAVRVGEAAAARQRELDRLREELGRVVTTDEKQKLSVAQARRAADLGAYLQANDATLRPVLSEGYTRYRELDLALRQDAERSVEKSRLAGQYGTAVRKLGEAATAENMQAVRLRSVQASLGELVEAAQRLAVQRRLRDRHTDLEPKQLELDLAALDAEAETLNRAVKPSELQRRVTGLLERLGRLESYLARAAVGPNPVRTALRASKGLQRLRDGAGLQELAKNIRAADKTADAESSKEAAFRLQEAATWMEALARLGSPIPAVPEWPSTPREPKDPQGGEPGGGGTSLPTLSEWELWIRVYPDDIAITRLEPRLTAAEVAAGRSYWTHAWYPSTDPELTLGAWRALVARYGSRRASWIVRSTRPLNDPPIKTKTEFEAAELAGSSSPDAHIKEAIAASGMGKKESELRAPVPSEIIAASDPKRSTEKLAATDRRLLESADRIEIGKQRPVFPEPVLREPGDHRPPTVSVLPERLLFKLTHRDSGGYAPVQFLGQPIPATLVTGPNPAEAMMNDQGAFTSTGNQAMRWMVDFDEALRVGMALRVVLPGILADPSDPQCGFQRIEVLGVQQGPVPAQQDATEQLEALFAQHQFTGLGMSILPQGTPTNTTADRSSGVDLGEPDPRRSFALLQDQFALQSELLLKKDGQHLAQALGLSPAVWQHVDGAAGTDIGTALAMNTALWSGTFGQHLEDLCYVEQPVQPASVGTDVLYPSRSLDPRPRLTQATLDQTRSFFSRYVLGRGRTPVLRIGRQPYGILAMSNLNQTEQIEQIDLFGNTQVKQQVTQEVWQAGTGLAADAAYRNGLYALLQRLHKGNSRRYSLSGVTHDLVGASHWLSQRNTVDSPLLPGESANDRFMHLLGLQATAAELLHRYGIIVPFDASYSQFQTFVQNLGTSSWASTLKAYNDLFTGPSDVVGHAFAALLNEKETTAFTMRHLSPLRSYAPLTKWVDGADPSAHLSYLLNTAPDVLMDAARTGSEPSNSVLYLLARKALLQAYWDASARVWEAESLLDGMGSLLFIPVPGLRTTTLAQGRASQDISDFIDEVAVTRDGALPSALVLPYIKGGFHRNRYKEFNTDTVLWNSVNNSITTTAGPRPTKRYFMELLTSRLAVPTQPAEALHKHLYRALGSTTRGPRDAHLAGLRQTTTALRMLQEKTVGQLDLALREHLDICSWRLDAWFAGLCFQRLEEQRARTAKNLVGAYGWVQDLRPTGGTVNHGHIHGPSLQHALTGAVLRAAQLGGNGDVAAINLSSYRVRQAQALLDGIRSGQGLPALLGYQLERRLHELNPALNRFVIDLRAQFPLVTSPTPAPAAGGARAESVAARNVVDGLALLRAYRAATTITLQSTPPGQPASASEAPQIQEALDDLNGALDAVGDLLLAEATFQTTRGNFERAAAALQVLSAGQLPPEPEVIKTPPSTIALEHRVGLCRHPSAAAPGAMGRALAEPTLNEWVGQILGDLAQIHFQYVVSKTDGTTETGACDVASLGLAPLDLVALLGTGELGPGTEFAGWATVHVWSILPGSAQCSGIKLDFASRDPLWHADIHTVRDTLPLARSLYRLIANARPLCGGDLATTTELDGLDPDRTARVRLPEFVGRVDEVYTAYAALRSQLATFPWGNHSGPDVPAFAALLRQVARYSLPEALPIELAVDGVNPAVYLRRVQGLVLGIMAQRLAGFSKARAQLAGGQATAHQVEIHTQALRELLGKDFQICPWFDAHSAVQLRTAAQYPPRLPALLAKERWLHGVALVRRNILPLEQSLMFGALWHDGTQQHLEPQILQLPYTADEPWLGLEYDPTLIPLDRERLSLVMLLPSSFAPEVAPVCGLLFDSWIEQLPISDEQRTGLAFHYDQPNAEAPQAVLLACHSRPDPATPWSYAELFNILDSTRQMIRLRSFEPDMLQPANPQATSNWPPQYTAQFIGLMGIGDIVTADFDELSVDFGVNNGTSGTTNPPTPTGPTDTTTPGVPSDPAEAGPAASEPRFTEVTSPSKSKRGQ